MTVVSLLTLLPLSRRAVLVKEPEKPEDEPLDVIPADFAVQSLVHEYGGGGFSVSGNMVIFSNDKDQRLYKLLIGGTSKK